MITPTSDFPKTSLNIKEYKSIATITAMEIDKNSEFAKLCGCWHEHDKENDDPQGWKCTCGKVFKYNHKVNSFPCLQDHIKEANPDYAADPRLVLREMMRIRKFVEFINYLFEDYIFAVGAAVTLAEYMMDTTGLLLKKAMEFLKEKRDERQI